MATITTTAAATQAGVTVATIRTWARRGVIAAVKTAGRWVIDTTSLAHRIAIGARRTRKATMTLDLTASITLPAMYKGDTPQTLTPVIKRRIDKRTGANVITVRSWVPLIADKLNAIPDEGDRLHCVNVLASTVIVISDTPDAEWADDPQAREDGQLRTSYRGDIRQVTIGDVLDLAAQLRTQLAA
ncbi:hypothetical protein PV405_34385 [Streptomyces sp. ME02-6979-3A]|uniref:hypothetical protein n=1 Tax=Streptomyces sp. ME02-6979-3A TaxID=3028673 RepID=UPI0029B3ACCF|nr:hypothetical protein [Streptomyces sp. ME02-6979-3A]MDX3329685.1 hypothetical protein [Streptomyces sp. ME02-6979-3A]